MALGSQRATAHGTATAAPPGVAEHTYARLRDMIAGGELPPGHAIEERRLAARLNVSRTPLRIALSRLLGEEMLGRLSNGALVVRQIGPQEFMETIHLRRLLESEAAALAAGEIPEPELQAVRTRIEQARDSGRVDGAAHWALDDQLHALVARHSGSSLLARSILDIRRRVRMCNVERAPGRFAETCAEHLALIEALAAGDRDGARRAMSDHLDQVRRGLSGFTGQAG